jgi:hypothetical protein
MSLGPPPAAEAFRIRAALNDAVQPHSKLRLSALLFVEI